MLASEQVLDKYYLDVRCMLLEIAATLDRHDRGDGGRTNGNPARDERLEKIYQALALLAEPKTTADRSERLLNHFSDLD